LILVARGLLLCPTSFAQSILLFTASLLWHPLSRYGSASLHAQKTLCPYSLPQIHTSYPTLCIQAWQPGLQPKQMPLGAHELRGAFAFTHISSHVQAMCSMVQDSNLHGLIFMGTSDSATSRSFTASSQPCHTRPYRGDTALPPLAVLPHLGLSPLHVSWSVATSLCRASFAASLHQASWTSCGIAIPDVPHGIEVPNLFVGLLASPTGASCSSITCGIATLGLFAAPAQGGIVAPAFSQLSCIFAAMPHL
jgi:hypothetical protein